MLSPPLRADVQFRASTFDPSLFSSVLKPRKHLAINQELLQQPSASRTKTVYGMVRVGADGLASDSIDC